MLEDMGGRRRIAFVGSAQGSQWGYSNIGYVLIQLLLEDVTGHPLAQIMQETVFTPLHMESSTPAYPLAGNLRKREAMPLDKEGKAAEPAMHPTALAQGGLVTPRFGEVHY